MYKNVNVVAIQAFVPQNHIEGELQVKRLVSEACKQPVDIVGLPEDCLAPLKNIREGYQPFNFLSNIAKEHQIYLFGANVILESDGAHNRGFIFDREGSLLHYHDKIVLTPPEEKDGLIAGKTLEVFETEFGKMAILVCKDSFHRYAAWFFNQLQKAGVDVVLIPSYSLNVSKRSTELWVDSLKALAKWFDVYIVAPGTIGKNST
jgi:predicted amidohydrolase